MNEGEGDAILTRVRLYKVGGRVELSEFVPTLESLGLRAVEELPTALEDRDGQEWFLHDFGVLDSGHRPLDLDGTGARIAECIAAVWRGACESDSLNRLVVTAGLDWRQVQILRAYRKFHHRVNASFPVEYKNEAFASHPEIASGLVRLFELRFDPSMPKDPEAQEALRSQILADLDAVVSLEQDRILRNALGVIDATVRTNAFLPARPAMSLKFRSADVPEMPKPTPLYEVFVYSTDMEAIHLRGGKAARGGIRWSDRRQDYRSEVLGLMKAQMVKNAVIVPTGAKGGFVLKRPCPIRPSCRTRRRGSTYTFIRALLDVTDNLVDGKVVHPEHVVIHDEDDPYLVVAADKGTATFSDTGERDLGRVRVLARRRVRVRRVGRLRPQGARDHGTWCVGVHQTALPRDGHRRDERTVHRDRDRRHVRRRVRERDAVFGTDLPRRRVRPSPRLPRPDAESGGGLRGAQAAVRAAGSSWDDYERSAISRRRRRLAAHRQVDPRVSREARLALGIEDEELTPSGLISAILRAPVDLLYNGGIGTYVKASTETTRATADDRVNDEVRVERT